MAHPDTAHSSGGARKPAKALVPLALALRRAHDWSEAALFQGRRLGELLDYHLSFDRRNAMPAEWRAFRAANVLPGGAPVETLESYLFLVALHRLTVSLRLLSRAGQKPDKALEAAAKAFTKAVPTAAQLRKVLDHEEEGLLAGGKQAEFFSADAEAAPAPVATDGDYIMGGQVSLPRAIAALQKLTPLLAGARPARETTAK